MFKHALTSKMVLSAAVALVLGFGAATAHAGTAGYSGSSCQPTIASVPFIEYSPFGVHNVSATSVVAGGPDVMVSCPIPVPFNSATTGTLQTVTVRVFDRFNGGTPSLIGQDFSCTIYYQNSSGVTITGPTQSPVLFSVANSFQFTLTVGAIVTGASMLCHVPSQTASGVSHILNYNVVTL